MEISVYWKDYRGLCAIKYLRLEDFIDFYMNGMTIHLEPQGILFAEVSSEESTEILEAVLTLTGCPFL